LLGQVSGVGIDARGDVLVFRRASRTWLSDTLSTDPIAEPTVLRFSAQTGELTAAWGAGQFAMPHGLSVDHQGNVWLTDVALHQVFKLDPGGRQLLTLGQRGVPGSDRVHFDRPTDVAEGLNGSVYVSDGYRNTRVIEFDSSGQFVREWGQPGSGPAQFNVPHGIAVDTGGQAGRNWGNRCCVRRLRELRWSVRLAALRRCGLGRERLCRRRGHGPADSKICS
jgi:peptidylamidoglycolate lyase